jgi:Ca-activated chloride channel family protein
VIGFDVSNPQHQAQLRCLAENTGGRYFNARDAAELGAAIEGAVQASTEPPPPPAKATLQIGGPAVITQVVSIAWTGPADRGDFISFATPDSRDGDYIEYSSIAEPVDGGGQGTLNVRAPSSPGNYELRYVSPIRDQSVLARVNVQVSDAEAQLDAPDQAAAVTPVRIVAKGPVGPRNWIGIAAKGSAPGADVG